MSILIGFTIERNTKAIPDRRNDFDCFLTDDPELFTSTGESEKDCLLQIKEWILDNYSYFDKREYFFDVYSLIINHKNVRWLECSSESIILTQHGDFIGRVDRKEFEIMKDGEELLAIFEAYLTVLIDDLTPKDKQR